MAGTAPARTLPTATLRDTARRLALGPAGHLHALRAAPTGVVTTCEARVFEPESLFGRVASPDWHGIGLVAEGHAVGRHRPAVTVGLVVDRSGAGAVAFAGGPPGTDRAGRTVEVLTEPTGLLADIAHRMLGLPTAPEPVAPTELVLASWLHAVLDSVADPATARSVTTWSQVVDAHPAWRAGGSVFRSAVSGARSPHDVAAITVELSHRMSWRRLRRLAAAGTIAIPGLDAAAASWMDDSFFARWTLDVHRPVTELLDDLCLFLDGPLLADLRYTVQAVGWLGFAGSHESPTGDR